MGIYALPIVPSGMPLPEGPSWGWDYHTGTWHESTAAAEQWARWVIACWPGSVSYVELRADITGRPITGRVDNVAMAYPCDGCGADAGDACAWHCLSNVR